MQQIHYWMSIKEDRLLSASCVCSLTSVENCLGTTSSFLIDCVTTGRVNKQHQLLQRLPQILHSVFGWVENKFHQICFLAKCSLWQERPHSLLRRCLGLGFRNGFIYLEKVQTEGLRHCKYRGERGVRREYEEKILWSPWNLNLEAPGKDEKRDSEFVERCLN